ncbi:MAG: hypothetical protein AAFX55_01005 [Bacteroidota bacterium]
MRPQSNIKKALLTLSLALLLISVTNCTSTRVVASNYGDTFAGNESYETDSWSYLWGMVKKDVSVEPDADDSDHAICDEGSLANVEVKTTFGGALLTIVTLGIVNHRKVSFACSRPSNGDGGLDD